MKTPLEVGITGGIGSGKSIITKIFQSWGTPIYDADFRAKWLMSHSQPLKYNLIQAFGKATYLADGTLDRRYLASQVFNNSEQVNILNNLVHPAVAEDYASWVKKYITKPYVLREAALMVESGSYKTLHKMITVFAPVSLRIQRVRARDPHRSESEIQAIIDKQLPEEEKIKLADYVIYNDDKHMVLPQVLELHQEFLKITLVT